MRFDDSLTTILAADPGSGAAAAAAWRQLVDLAGRGRIVADEPVIARLRLLRQAVEPPVRAATGRSLAFATPGPALVGLFAEDILAVAAPVLRTAVLPAADWLAILPRMSPEGRSILRHRRDLPGEVVRGLESFGATDFVLPYAGAASEVDRTFVPPADTPRSATPFVAVGAVARDLPVVVEARQRAEPVPDPARFEIADLVARIDAFNSRRDSLAPPTTATVPAMSFRYETDAAGTITWVDGVNRAAIVGVSIAHAVRQGEVAVDAVMSGALRQRARFEDARLDIGGRSDAAGSWRVAGVPAFDEATGRFTGMRGVARRPRPDETAAAPADRAGADALRQLVHELRTPTNAIAGFAELIEAQLLGPVAPSYRDHATTIRDQATLLIAAIDDLDTAARIEGRALELRAAPTALDPLLAEVLERLEPLVALRRATVRVERLGEDMAHVDDRMLDRLLSRLIAALVTATVPDEVITIGRAVGPAGTVALRLSRPRSLKALDEGGTLISIDEETGDDGASLLGAGFALRLARNLATELGGALVFAPDRLTLRLPAVVTAGAEQAGR